MIKLENYLGTIQISENFFANLVGYAASRCFGVAGMAPSSKPAKSAAAWLKKPILPTKGVRIRSSGDLLVIELHIIVTYGVNISAIVKSIGHKVRYTVEQATSPHVGKVNVFVDGMLSE